MRSLLNALDGALSRIEFAIIAVFSVAALFLGVTQVVLRYVFNTGFTWSEAIFVLMTVAAMLFAGSRAVRDDGHVRVDLLSQVLPGGARKVLRNVRYVLSLALCGLYLYAGYGYVQFTHSMGTIAPNSGLPHWVIFLIVPVTMAFFCLRYVLLLLREAGGEETGAPAHRDDPGREAAE